MINDLNNDLNIYLEEWISIQNIVSDKKYNNTFIDTNVDNGICNKINIDNCKTDDCEIYEKTSTFEKICVNKLSIKKFEDGVEILGKNNKKYKIIHDNTLFEHSDDVISYYYILKSDDTNNIYILFSTGFVFFPVHLSDVEFAKNMNDLAEAIIDFDKNEYNKVILCGHSMGCVIALHIGGGIIKTKDENFFNEKVIIVGSGPFTYSETEISYNHSKNIKIFVNIGIYKNTKYIDGYSIKNNKNNYKPLTYILDGKIIDLYGKYNNNSKEDDVYYYTGSNISELKLNYFHVWDLYYKNINLFKNNNKGGKTKKTRKQKKSKKMTRRRRKKIQ